MGFTLKVSGPPAIAAGFETFATDMVRYGLREPIDYVFKQAEAQARAQSPVKTGYLRSSIHSASTATGAKLFAAANYALYVDKRVPYFSNAVDYINRTLPPLVQRAINEQAGIISRKFFGG